MLMSENTIVVNKLHVSSTTGQRIKNTAAEILFLFNSYDRMT